MKLWKRAEGRENKERFELCVEKQLRCGKQKPGIDTAEGENGINQRGKEDKNMEHGASLVV